MPSSSNDQKRQKAELLQDQTSTMNDATRGGSTAAFSSSKAGRVLSAEAPSAADPRVEDAPACGAGSGRVIPAGEDGVTGIRSKVEVHGPGDDARLQEMLQTIGQ